MVFSSVTSLSDDDAEAAGPAEAEAAAPPSPSARPRKRRRKTMSPKRSSNQMTVDEMVAKLRQPCSCKKIDCFQQFSSEPKLSSFKAYFEEWMSLSKLDKDNLVCLALFQFVFGQYGKLTVMLCQPLGQAFGRMKQLVAKAGD